MSVLDASILVDALVVVGEAGDRARAELQKHAVLQVPANFGAEAMSALRALVRRGELDSIRAFVAVQQIRSVRTVQYPFEPFADRIWQLRENLTAYDAWYVALAERIDTDLITRDERLAKSSGPRCPIRLI